MNCYSYTTPMARYTLYAANTPNGQKIPIFMEEAGLDYELHFVHFNKREQFDPAYLKLNPNNKIPTLVDHEKNITVFESGAILLYLAEQHDLMPTDLKARYTVIEWLFFQMAGIGPMFGQLNYFKMFAEEPVPQAIDRFATETHRLLNVLEGQLAHHKYIAGHLSIADFATWPWVNGAINFTKVDMSDFPKVVAWHKDLAGRPSVQKGLQVLANAA